MILSYIGDIDICGRLEYCAAYSGNSVPTFRDKLSLPSSRVKSQKKTSFFLDFFVLQEASEYCQDSLHLRGNMELCMYIYMYVWMYVSSHKPKKHHLLALLGFLAYTFAVKRQVCRQSPLSEIWRCAKHVTFTHTLSYIIDIIRQVFNFHHNLSVSRVTYLQKGRYAGNTV